MKHLTLITTLLFFAQLAIGQEASSSALKTTNNQGKLYVYWGWNWESYSRSDIHFQGQNYDFTLKDVVAKHRPGELSAENYFSIKNFTVPQYSFRVGYFINDKWDISIGMDHMKYVVQANQTVRISGSITNTGTVYDGVYDNNEMIIKPSFLQMEHTDGLNYINTDIRRNFLFFEKGSIRATAVAGIGAGILIPKTDITLFSQKRHDEVHLSGYGINAILGLNLSFRNKFFIQSECKGGYINMPDIKTTYVVAEKASQSFFFRQVNIVFGYKFRLNSTPSTQKASK